MNDAKETKGLATAVLAFTATGMACMLTGMVLFSTFGGNLVNALDERLGEVLMNRGIRLEEAGQYANAREAYRRALEQDFYGPQNRAMTCKRLGVLFWLEGRYDAAFTYLAKAAEYEPPIVSAFEPLVDSYILLMRYDEASRAIDRWMRIAQQLDTPEETAKALYHRGRVALGRENRAQAIEAFEAALRTGSDNRSAYRLALLHFEAGEFDAALEDVARYIEMGGGPRSEELRNLRRLIGWKRAGLS